MSLRITLAVAKRVLLQIRHDHRTLAMLVAVPALLLALLWWMFQDSGGIGFDKLGPSLLALFPFVIMFLVTSVTTLRERSGGTLERLLAMPMNKLDLLLGYAVAFGVMAAVQSMIAVLVSVYLLDLDIDGPLWMLIVVAVANAVLGIAVYLRWFAVLLKDADPGPAGTVVRRVPRPALAALVLAVAALVATSLVPQLLFGLLG